MERNERFGIIQRLLKGRRTVALAELKERLEASRSTIFRDLAYLRDRLGVPVVHDPEAGGYRLDGCADSHELPGLWFSAEEIHALLTMQQLLANLDPGGVLGPHIEPLKGRLAKLLESGEHPAAEVGRRIRILTIAARRYPAEHFQAIASALLRRRRLLIGYDSRGRGERTEQREISPQRLVHYRDNWYLDAWCHWRGALRNFSVDAVARARMLDTPALEIDSAQLDDALGTGYGIFAGRDVRQASLRFTPERARWVAHERWHPDQVGRWDAHGHWLLDLPYADPRELVMDILRHVPEVEVLAPEELRDEVVRRLRAGLRGHETQER